jgi:predicted Zn-dependent protease
VPADVRQKIAFHRLKAAIASGLKENAAAVGEMRAALELAPIDPQLLVGTAVAESQAGELDRALGHARAAGESAAAQALIGDIEGKRGKFPEAVSAYQAAIALAPDSELYRVALATTLIQHQAFEAAIEMLKGSPKSAKLRVLLGLAQYGHGDNAEAVESLEEAVALDPALESAKRCLAGIVLESAKAPDRRAEELLCGWDKTVCAALELRRAHEEGDAARGAQAIAVLKRDDSPVAHCALGRAYEWRNQMNDAAREMESCVRLDPTPQHHYMLGLIYRKLGKTGLAHRELELRSRMLQRISDEATLSLNALAAFQRQN